MPFLGKVPSQIVDSDVDIDGGTIDGATIGSITAGAGTFTNLSATGTITFPDDGISGDDINGGTISNFTSTGIDDNATSTAVTIDSSENVGIGTSSPSDVLHVKKSSGALNCRVETGDSDSSAHLYQNSTTGTTTNDGLFVGIGSGEQGYFYHYESEPLIFGTNNTERMRIDSSGNVGIGTTSTSGLKLNVLTTDSDNLVARFENSHATGSYGIAVKAGDDSGNYCADFANKSGTSLMRIRGDGNVGIGTTSPASKLEVNGATGMRSNGGGYLVKFLNSSSTSELSGFIYDNNQNNIEFTAYDSSYALVFKTNNTERMRINSNGQLLVGTTSSIDGRVSINAFTSNSGCIATSNNGLTVYYPAFFYHSGSLRGYIATTSSSTQYATSSDARLKENIVDAPAGNIDDIRVRSFDWKADGTHQTYGVIAQELVEVAPEAVSQGATEDSVWGVDYSKLVPMMIKEIQDLKAEVAALKGA